MRPGWGGRTLEGQLKRGVDHKMLSSWGGDAGLENLPSLCQECIAERRTTSGRVEAYADQTRAAVGYEEPAKANRRDA
jgi:hypothetical protein